MNLPTIQFITIQDVSGSALLLNDGVSDNSVYSNTIVNPSAEEKAIDNEDQDYSMFEDSDIIQSLLPLFLLILRDI